LLPLVAILVVALLASVFALRQKHQAPKALLQISSVSGSTFRRNGLVWVRLRARVCDTAQTDTTLAEVDIGHYAVSRTSRTWWLAHGSEQFAPGPAPLRKTWHGKTCGPLEVEDPIPPADYGADALGNPNACYGVDLRIVAADKREASKRAVVECPFRTRSA
jgi:hypothetical protein